MSSCCVRALSQVVRTIEVGMTIVDERDCRIHWILMQQGNCHEQSRPVTMDGQGARTPVLVRDLGAVAVVMKPGNA